MRHAVNGGVMTCPVGDYLPTCRGTSPTEFSSIDFDS
jgi:hypothetical protein